MLKRVNPLNGRLHPDHAGIAAWYYAGNETLAKELPQAIVRPLFVRAGQLAASAIDKTYKTFGLDPAKHRTTYYHRHLGRYGLVDADPEKWRAMVIPFSAGQEQLYYAQLQLHLDGEEINREIGEAFVELRDAAGIRVADGKWQKTINLIPAVRVLPRVELTGIGNEIANIDAWLPKTADHGPSF